MSVDISGGRTRGASFLLNQFDDVQNLKGTISLFLQVFFGAMLGYTVGGLNPSITKKLQNPIGISIIVFINLYFIISKPKVLRSQEFYLYMVLLSVILAGTIWLSVAMMNQLDDKFFKEDEEEIIVVTR